MNMNVLINMIVRQLMRRAVNFGIGAGINAASKRGKAAKSHGQRNTPPVAGHSAKQTLKKMGLARRGPWR